MKGLTLGRIAEVTGGTFHLSFTDRNGQFVTAAGEDQVPEEMRGYLQTEVSSITTDSRKAEEGSLFGAIVGERVDGHAFIASVFDRGALCVLSERELGQADLVSADAQGQPSCRAWIRVEDTVTALRMIAKEYRSVMQIPVVGVTGSVGKTSTKEMIASVLSVRFRTLKTEGNFNNDLGLPLTVFRLREEHEIAVLEMGVSHFGDMDRLAEIARPDLMVITNIGTCHLEYLQDRDGVFRAKTEVFDHLAQDGRVILSGNDDRLRRVRDVHGIRPVFFGVDTSVAGAADLSAGPVPEFPGDLDEDRCVRVTDIRLCGFEGSVCTLHTPQGEMTVRVPVPGIHNASNAAAAAAVGLACGMSLDEIRQGIESAKTISGRFRVLHTDHLTVIDDCYNANPVSMKASVAVLALSEGRRVAILGDMAELGEDEARLHEEVGAYTAGRADKLIAVGSLAAHLYSAARSEDPDLDASLYGSVEEFLAHKGSEIRDGDTILVKASHCMHFDRIVEELTKTCI